MLMDDKPKHARTFTRSDLGAAGIGAFAVLCCAGGPLMAGLLGTVVLATAVGVGAGVLALITVVLSISARVRRRTDPGCGAGDRRAP